MTSMASSDYDDESFTSFGSHTKTLTELAVGSSRTSSRKAERSMTSSRKVGKTLRKAGRSLRYPSWDFTGS